jgi:hypothetical protein
VKQLETNKNMKKTLILVLFAVVVSATAQAQSFSLGPKAGINISNYTGGDIKSKSRVGYHLGGLLNFGIGSVVSLQPEVLLSGQGAKIENNGFRQEFKISYITVPVLLKFKGRSGLFFELGPQFGFRSSQDIPDQTISHFAKNLDLSGAVGLGWQSNIGLGIGFRYVAGLSKVGDFSASNLNPDFRNSVIQGSIFWAIPLID